MRIKNYAKKLVEDRPDPATPRTLVPSRKPVAIRFRVDGIARDLSDAAFKPALCLWYCCIHYTLPA